MSGRFYVCIWIFFVLQSGHVLHAQDKHFSQYFNAPLQLNPALSGLIQGTYRFNLNNRSQWQGIDGDYLSTLHFSADMNFNNPFNGFKEDLIGIGLSFLTDKANDYGLQTNELIAALAYHKKIGKYQYLSGGLRAGLLQRAVGFENLTFEDQYVEGSGYNRNTGELLPANNIASAELGLGLNYSWSVSDQKGVNIGFSVNHLTSPDFSFFNLSLPANTSPIKQPLYGTFIGHAAGAIPMGEGTALMPRVWFVSQGEHFMINTGATLKFPLDPDQKNKLQLGLYLRAAQNFNTLGLESLIPMVAFDMGKVNISMSYDANARRFAPSYLQQNIFELSLTFLGRHDNEALFCPQF